MSSSGVGVDSGEGGSVPCGTFGEFKEALTELRVFDDKIIYEMNKAVPTASFDGTVDKRSQCQAMFDKLNAAFALRNAGIGACISQQTGTVSAIRDGVVGSTPPPTEAAVTDTRTQQGKGKNIKGQRHLREQQWALRQMKAEASAEEILQDQTMTVFKARCGRYLR